jgi:hypothetical protein
MRLWGWFALAVLAASSCPPRGGLAAAAPPAEALPQGITAEGHHYLGRGDAPVTLIEYGDFL